MNTSSGPLQQSHVLTVLQEHMHHVSTNELFSPTRLPVAEGAQFTVPVFVHLSVHMCVCPSYLVWVF